MKKTTFGPAITACIVLAFSKESDAETRMKYPLLDSSADESVAIAESHGGVTAVDIPTTGNPTLHAPITGTVVEVIESEPDNTLGASALKEAYNFQAYGLWCTPKSRGYGNKVKIRAADETIVLMAHLKQNSVVVEVGSQVYAGQPIANVGSSGWVCTGNEFGTGQHVHLEYQDPQGIKHLPKDRMCEPLLYPGDDPGACDVGGVPPQNEFCGNGSCAGAETCDTCPQDCACAVCTNGERRRCWVECSQDFPPECVYGGLTPLIMGIETCAEGQWGICETSTQCQSISSECINGEEYPVSYECVDGTVKNGDYNCSQQLGVNCNTSFYTGWPFPDCNSLCLPEEGCQVEGELRACEVYCDVPNGTKKTGAQDCRNVCNTLWWSPCYTNDACSQ